MGRGEDWRAWLERWGRAAVALALLGTLWLLAGPREAPAPPLSVDGTQLERAQGAGGAERSSGSIPARRRRVVVHVAGAVKRPGVYRMNAPGRLMDAVERAGGLTDDADLTQVNLAARLTDGRQIIVPRLGGGGVATENPDAAAGALASGAKLNVNSATAEQLDGLDGVGPATAEAIIAMRTKLGGFTSLDQLDEVDGIGEKRLSALRGQLQL